MKAFHFVMGLILLVILVGGAAYAVASTMGYAYPGAESAVLTELGRRIVGAVVLLVVVLYGISAIPSAKDDNYISFDNEWGVVNVSIKAVTEFIARLAREFAGIVSLDASVFSKGDNGIELIIDLRVKAGTNIPELCQMFQQRCRTSINESLGVADVRAVKINVREIVAADGSTSSDREDRMDV